MEPSWWAPAHCHPVPRTEGDSGPGRTQRARRGLQPLCVQRLGHAPTPPAVLLSLILLLPWGLEQVPKVSRGPSQFALGGKRGWGVTPKQGSGQGEGVLSTWQWPLLRHPYADGITAKWSRPQPTCSPSRSARAHRRVWGASRSVGCRLPLRAGCGHWRLQSPRVLWMPSQVSKASSEQRFLNSVPLFWELLGQTPSPTVFITGALSSLYPLRVPTWRWAEHGKKSNVVPQCI